MKKFLSAAALFVLIASAISCDIAPKPMAKAYFWTIQDHNDPRVLFIDGKNSGRLPFVEEKQDDENEAITNDALEVNLSSGKYALQIINDNGRVINEGTLELKKSSNSETITTSWGKGANCKVKVVYQ